MPERLDDGMAALRRDYVSRLRITLAGLELDVDAWRAGEEEAGARLRRTAHRLYGSGATYGFPALTAAAEACEMESEADTAPDERGLRALQTLIRVAREIVGSAPR